MTKPINHTLLPKQLEFTGAQESEVLYSGAFGAGKTRAVCEKVVMHACIPHNRVGLCRKTLKSLKATTLVTLLQGDGFQPPVLPPGAYVYNKSDQVIKLNGAGEIVCFGMDDYQKIGSLNLGACGVDEAVELDDYTDWMMLRGRCRNEADPHRQLFGACNPGPPTHFLATRFGLAGSLNPAPGCRAIETCSSDNWFLPKDYQDWLDSLTGTHRARYRDGLWVGFEGLVYDSWERKVHIKERDISRMRRLGFVDEGYTNPGVIVSVGEDGDGRLHVFREFYERQINPSDFVAEAVRRQAEDNIEWFVVDPSAAGLIADMKAAGLQVADTAEVNNDVFDGIRHVQDRLKVQGDGNPRLTIDPSCEQTIREFESYIWKPGRDEPVKQFDHAVSAIRYGVMWLEQPTVPITIGITRIARVRTR